MQGPQGLVLGPQWFVTYLNDFDETVVHIVFLKITSTFVV